MARGKRVCADAPEDAISKPTEPAEGGTRASSAQGTQGIPPADWISRAIGRSGRGGRLRHYRRHPGGLTGKVPVVIFTPGAVPHG